MALAVRAGGEAIGLADGNDRYARLMAHAAGWSNDHVFACMISSLCAGEGALPDWLGLQPAAFHCLLDYHFSGLDLGHAPQIGRQVARSRQHELNELVDLMLMDKAGDSPSEVWMAHTVAAGCMGADHLLSARLDVRPTPSLAYGRSSCFRRHSLECSTSFSPSRGYVMSECIGTLGCFTSPELYGGLLNSTERGTGRCGSHETTQ